MLKRKPALMGRLPTLVLATAVVVSACNPMSGSVEKARVLLARNDLNAARIEAASIVQRNEDDAEAHLLLGEILSAQGDFATAERVLRRAFALGIERHRVDPVLAHALLRTGQFKAILDEIEPGPGHRGKELGLVQAARARAMLARGDLDQAQAMLESALEAAPDLPEAQIAQAQLAHMRNDPAGAMRLVEQVLVRHPHDAEAWATKARLLVLAGNAEAAIAAYGEAAKCEPTNLAPNLAAAELLMRAGRFEEARMRIDAVIERAPDYIPGRYTQAHWHYLKGEFDKALEVAQLARKGAPGFPPLAQLIAMLHLARGNLNQAEDELRALNLAEPQNDEVRRLYAVTLLRKGQPKTALDVIAPALEKSPRDATWLRLAADAHAAMRNYSRAAQVLERASNLGPANAALEAQLGLLRVAGGDATRGLRELENAAAASNESTGPATALVLLHLGRREYDKALETALGIQRRAPAEPIGFHLAGIALVAAKNTPRAVKAFERAVALDASFWPSIKALARTDEAAGQPERARARIEALLARDPSNVEAQYARYHFTGDRGDLLAALESAGRADPKRLAPRLMLVRELSASGLVAEAMAVAREAAAIAPHDAQVLMALGDAQLAAKRSSEALETFRRLINDRPRWPAAQLRYAHTQATLGDSGGAEASFKKVLVLRPHDPEAMAGLVKLYLQSNRDGEAMRLAEELKTHQPNSGVGDVLAGDILIAGNKPAEALAAYDAAHARAPSGTLLIRRHRASLAMGADPGVAPLSSWLARAPRDVPVRFYLGNRLYAAGQYEAAATEFRRIVEADPKHGHAYNNLANAYLKLEDPRGLQTARSAHALLPDDADVLDTLGVALTRAGKPEQGAEMIRKALGRNPASREYQVHYALALAQAGDQEGGRAVIDKLAEGSGSLALDPGQRRVLGLP